MADILQRLQLNIAAKLRSESYFDEFPIYAVRNVTIEQDIANALAGIIKQNGKAGLTIQVLLPTLRTLAPVPSGKGTVVQIIVRVQEIPEINFGAVGTQTSSEDVAIYAARVLQIWSDDGGQNVLKTDTANAVTPDLSFAPRLTYDVPIIKEVELPALTRVAPVTFTVAGTVTLASTTGSAAIYYSTDPDTFPAEGSGQIYTVPFTTPASGTTIYAAAYKAGLSGSNVTKMTI